MKSALKLFVKMFLVFGLATFLYYNIGGIDLKEALKLTVNVSLSASFASLLATSLAKKLFKIRKVQIETKKFELTRFIIFVVLLPLLITSIVGPLLNLIVI